MTHFTKFIERIIWGVAGLAVSMIILFAILHVLRSNPIATAPVVGAPVAAGATWVGQHIQNY